MSEAVAATEVEAGAGGVRGVGSAGRIVGSMFVEGAGV